MAKLQKTGDDFFSIAMAKTMALSQAYSKNGPKKPSNPATPAPSQGNADSTQASPSKAAPTVLQKNTESFLQNSEPLDPIASGSATPKSNKNKIKRHNKKMKQNDAVAQNQPAHPGETATQTEDISRASGSQPLLPRQPSALKSSGNPSSQTLLPQPSAIKYSGNPSSQTIQPRQPSAIKSSGNTSSQTVQPQPSAIKSGQHQKLPSFPLLPKNNENMAPQTVPINISQSNKGQSEQPYSAITQMNLITRMELLESSCNENMQTIRHEMTIMRDAFGAVRSMLENKQSSANKAPIEVIDLTEPIKSAEAIDLTGPNKSAEVVDLTSTNGASENTATVQVQENQAEPKLVLSIKPVEACFDKELPIQLDYYGMPRFIKGLTPYKSTILENTPMSLAQSYRIVGRDIIKHMGGRPFNATMYYDSNNEVFEGPVTPINQEDGTQAKPVKSYYLYDAFVNPFVPKAPGAHGASLVALDRNSGADDNVSFENFPIFVALPSQPKTAAVDKEYVYMGHYSQTRWSDRLGYNEQSEIVPEHVKQHWADLISADRSAEAEWMGEEIIKLTEPMPYFDIDFSTFSRNAPFNEKMCRLLKDYLVDLQEIEEEKENFRKSLTFDRVMQLYEDSDGCVPAGIRFSWEYLQCINYDRTFITSLKSACDEKPAPKTRGARKFYVNDNTTVRLRVPDESRCNDEISTADNVIFPLGGIGSSAELARRIGAAPAQMDGASEQLTGLVDYYSESDTEPLDFWDRDLGQDIETDSSWDQDLPRFPDLDLPAPKGRLVNYPESDSAENDLWDLEYPQNPHVPVQADSWWDKDLGMDQETTNGDDEPQSVREPLHLRAPGTLNDDDHLQTQSSDSDAGTGTTLLPMTSADAESDVFSWD